MAARLPISLVKARFAECVRRAESGEEVVLTRHGRPVARIAPTTARSAPPAAGAGGHTTSPPSEVVREAEAVYDASRQLSAAPASRRETLDRLLREEIWPRVPGEALGKGVDKPQREAILGYGGDGV